MATRKISGSTAKDFFTSSAWPDGWYYDYLEAEINGETFADGDDEIDWSDISDTAVVRILGGTIIKGDTAKSVIDGCHPEEMPLITFFNQWYAEQTTEKVVVRIPKGDQAGLKALLKGSAYKVL